MTTEKINSFLDYLKLIDDLKVSTSEIQLFRGQSEVKPLIPSIARKNQNKDTTELEKSMLAELIRQSQILLDGANFDEWDWLIYAQHFGMKTRLLDWTSNPLTALWFSCINQNHINRDSVVYIFLNAEKYLLDKSKEKSPFTRTRTKVLKPTLNNSRVIAQAGWFTAHKYSNKDKKFVDLRTNGVLKNNLIEVIIPQKVKADVLESLHLFGINNRTLYNDISGICQHINWEFINRK